MTSYIYQSLHLSYKAFYELLYLFWLFFFIFNMISYLFLIKMIIRIKRWKLLWHLRKSKNHYPSTKRLNKKVDQERRKFHQRSKRQNMVKCVDIYFINTNSIAVRYEKDPRDLTYSLISSWMNTIIALILMHVQDSLWLCGFVVLWQTGHKFVIKKYL